MLSAVAFLHEPRAAVWPIMVASDGFSALLVFSLWIATLYYSVLTESDYNSGHQLKSIRVRQHEYNQTLSMKER